MNCIDGTSWLIRVVLHLRHESFRIRCGLICLFCKVLTVGGLFLCLSCVVIVIVIVVVIFGWVLVGGCIFNFFCCSGGSFLRGVSISCCGGWW